MRRLVARSTMAQNIWNLWSEVTSQLPDVTVIEAGLLPDDTFVIHCPTTVRDVEMAEGDMLAHPGMTLVCAVSRMDEEITIAPGDRKAIDDFWSRYASTGRLFGTVGDAAAWVAQRMESVAV